MKDDFRVCFHLLLHMIDIIFRESFLQLTTPKTHLTASPVDFQNRLCYTMIREKKL